MRVSEQWTLGAAYLRSLFSYCIDGPPRPFSATFAVTNRCNLRCSYCNSPFLDPAELDPDSIGVLFSRLAVMGVRRLGLAGGEPLLRSDLGDIVHRAKRHGFWVSVNSNLNLFAKRGASLTQADMIYTSLDGTPATHAAARGDKQAEEVVRAMRELVRAGKPVVAICVVTEHSWQQVDYLLDLAEEVGFLVHFQPQCVDTELVRGSAPVTVTNDQWRAFWGTLAERKRAGRPIASSLPYLEYLSGWADFSVSALYDPTQNCAAGRGFLYIDPLGIAYPCAYTKGKVGGIALLREDWERAWDRRTPCTSCVVGPMLEFNLLFRSPLRAAFDHRRTYASQGAAS